MTDEPADLSADGESKGLVVCDEPEDLVLVADPEVLIVVNGLEEVFICNEMLDLVDSDKIKTSGCFFF